MLVLRTVTEADVDLLFRWANDRTVRQNAFTTEPIPYANHVAWFAKMLQNPAVKNYIMCETAENTAVGQIRFSLEEGTALIGYSIDESWRGKGLGSKLVRLGEEKLLQEMPEVQVLIARVKYENGASARVFEKCGFIKEELSEYLEYTKTVRRQ